MSNITQLLSVEHQNILRVLDAVLNECEQIENGKTPDFTYFNQVIGLIKIIPRSSASGFLDILP